MPRAVPAKQGLGPHHRAGERSTDGLVGEHEVARTPCRREGRARPRNARGTRSRIRVVEELPSASRPSSLARYMAVSALRSSASGLCERAPAPRERDPHAGRQPMLDPFDHRGQRQLVEEVLGDPTGCGGGLDVRADHHELVPPEAGDRVRLAPGLGQTIGHLPQEQVADVVAEEVVHDLEPVEVDEQHGQCRPGAPAGGQGLAQPVVQQRPVGQPGERVVQRLVGAQSPEALGQAAVLHDEAPPRRARCARSGAASAEPRA